jgi:small redox-active disulfide protein 2
MKIEVLGPGCPKCQNLEANAKTAVENLGLDCEVVKVSSIVEIASRGLLTTPALLVDGEVKVQGKVASVDEIKGILSEAPTK